ncbi:hypothetical protein CGRA01v4_11674 [Colletotrichum graminicola]|nr:hypothetical protein CGRA01v4_11674 [Colletotrichum graminicola]
MSSTGLERMNPTVIRCGPRGTIVAHLFRMGMGAERGQVNSWMLSGRAARSAIGNGYAVRGGGVRLVPGCYIYRKKSRRVIGSGCHPDR